MLVVILVIFAMIAVTLALFLLHADPAERENSGGVCTRLRPVALRSRWSRLKLVKEGDDAAKNVKVMTVSKETIYAMMQRGVYALNAKGVKTDVEGHAIDDGEDDRWARERMESICAELDLQHPDIISLVKLANDYCDDLEKKMDQFKESLCRFNSTLAMLAETRMAVENEIKKKSQQQCKEPGAADENVAAATATNNESSLRHWKPLPVDTGHTIVVASRADDDFLKMIEQFEKTLEEVHE